MKAASAVLPHTQRPVTILGLPPLLFGVTAGASVTAAGVTIAAGLPPLALPIAVAVFGGGWMHFWRATRSDHHHDRVFFNARRWWGAKLRHGRSLVSGGPR